MTLCVTIATNLTDGLLINYTRIGSAFNKLSENIYFYILTLLIMAVVFDFLRAITEYWFRIKNGISWGTFWFQIGEYERVNESLKNNNVITGGRRKTALTLEDVKHVTAFLLHFGDQHGMVLPGRIPGFARDDLRVLPSHYTRKAIWQLNTDAESPAVIRKVKLRSFSQLWKQLLPFIVVAKPMSDLCWTCQQNNTRVVRYVSGSHWTNYEQSKIIKLDE